MHTHGATSDSNQLLASPPRQASLQRLGTDYLDVYMLHWPGGRPRRPAPPRAAPPRPAPRPYASAARMLPSRLQPHGPVAPCRSADLLIC